MNYNNLSNFYDDNDNICSINVWNTILFGNTVWIQY